MEIVRSQNTRTIPEFYSHEVFHEGANFEIFLKFPNFLENDSGRAPALRVPRAVTRLTVHRSLP